MIVYTSDHWVLLYCMVDRAALQLFLQTIETDYCFCLRHSTRMLCILLYGSSTLTLIYSC